MSENLEKWDSILPITIMKTRSAILSISAAAFFTYAKSLAADFVFDDHEAILNNKDVTSPNTTFQDIFSNDFWGTPITHQSSHKSYRPVTILYFRLVYQVYGNVLDPFIFHLMNLILHALVSCFIYVIYNLIFENRCPKCSYICSILFAVHPVHTETVVGVVGAAELLSALFASLSFIIFHYGCVSINFIIPNIVFSFLSSVMSITAMLCKEQGITIVAVIIIYDLVIIHKLVLRNLLQSLFWVMKRHTLQMFRFWDYSNNSNKSNGLLKSYHIETFKQSFAMPMFARHFVIIFMTVIAIYYRWLLMGSTLPVFQETDNPTSFEKSLFSRIVNYNYIYAINLWLFLCPEWLCFDWSMGCIPLIKFDMMKFDFRIIFIFLFWWFSYFLIRGVFMSDGISHRILVMGLSSMFILFSPASNIFFRVGFVIAERVLYLPSIGYFLVVVLGIQKLASLEQYKKIYKLFIVLLIVLFSLRSYERTENWINEKQLFESALNVCPLNAKVHYNLAKNSADQGLRQIAIDHYEEALRLHPKYDLAMNNLANIYRDEGMLVKAEELLTRAIKIRPDFATAWMNLGIVYSSMGSWNSSEMCYLEALKHRKKYPDCLYNLGNLYLEMKRDTDALEAWKNATILKPSHRIAWSNLIVMLDSMGRLNEALNESYSALSYLPNEPNIHFNIANVLGKMNEYELSEKHFVRAIQLNSTIPSFHYNLGVLYHRWGKFCQAEVCYRMACRLDSHSKAKKQLNILEQNGKLMNCFKKEQNWL